MQIFLSSAAAGLRRDEPPGRNGIRTLIGEKAIQSMGVMKINRRFALFQALFRHAPFLPSYGAMYGQWSCPAR